MQGIKFQLCIYKKKESHYATLHLNRKLGKEI